MQLNAAFFVFLVHFLITEKISSSPLQTQSKGVFVNELIRYSEPAMYKSEEVRNFHNRRRRSIGGVTFNKPLRISFFAHNRAFNLVLRTDDRIFADDVVFDSTSRSVAYDTRRVYTGVLEGEENSLVEGVVTKEGLFDGTIVSKNEVYYVEPVARYKPSERERRSSPLPPEPRVHTIIYKASDVELPPSFKSHSCASQSLHLSRMTAREETGELRAKRSLAPRPSHPRKVDVASSLPSVNTHDEIIESNILKTYVNVPDMNRTRNRKVNVTSVFKYPKFPNDVFAQSNVINRPKIFVRKNATTDPEPNELLPNGTLKHVNKRATVDPKKTTCMLYLQADHLFFHNYGTEEACIEVMTRHVQRVNSIYRSTDFNQDGKSDNISFMIKRIKVHTSESSKDSSYRFPGNYGVEKFLELFSEEDYDAFCLAYMFTYRDFEMGTLGLAWTGDLKNAGGVCEKNGHYRGSLKSLNTGIVTLLNYGKHVPPAVSHVTLAHEIGHNFGSPHDPETCTPGGEEGNYIMFARATSGDKKNNNKFSPCSLNSINPVLNSKARSQMGCFTEPQTAICGNGVVEIGEDCDCGWEEDCRDSCCFPQRRYPPAGEVPCKLTPSSICSPSQGPCCTSECQLKFGDKCRDDNGCRDSSYCDGRTASCPPSINKPNKTICNDEFVCFMGECTGSICLAYGLESCQCIPGPNDPVTKACELCCKKPGDDQPCISSFEWNEGPYDVPDMFSKPGTPCNNYNGYCDVFQKCREVDPSGPLATLRKLLLSEESLASVRKWVSEYWYAVALMAAFVLLLLYLSTALLGKHSDVKLKPVTIIHSPTTETVRLPPEGDPTLMVHPPAVRTKLPLHRKVREKKLHTKVGTRRKRKGDKCETAKKGSPDRMETARDAKKLGNQKRSRDDHEVPKSMRANKEESKLKEYRKQASEESRTSQKSGDTRTKHSEAPPKTTKGANQVLEKSSKMPFSDTCPARSCADAAAPDDGEKAAAVANSCASVGSGPIYENIPVNSNQESTGGGDPLKPSSAKIISSRLKRSNRVSTEIATETAKKIKEDLCERRETKSPVKIVPKRSTHGKSSPSNQKYAKKTAKKKKEVIEYENEENAMVTTRGPGSPSGEDPLGKVQNWLVHSISVGKASENFGIMTLTLPKSKSSPVGLSGTAKPEEIPIKPIAPPKIVHKNDRVIQIPKLSQKRSRSAGNLRKSDTRREEKVKLQVVYKPPFKFSVKLRNNRVLSAINTKFVEEKKNGTHVTRKNGPDGGERKQRTALLVRTTSSKCREEKRTSPHVLLATGRANVTENPFKFPAGGVTGDRSANPHPQLPIYLTDHGDIDSNVHTVPSDLDVLLSESEFLFSDD